MVHIKVVPVIAWLTLGTNSPEAQMHGAKNHRRRLRGGHVPTTIYNLNFVPTTFKNVQTNRDRKNPHILNRNRQVKDGLAIGRFGRVPERPDEPAGRNSLFTAGPPSKNRAPPTINNRALRLWWLYGYCPHHF